MFKDRELGDMFLSKHSYWLEHSIDVNSNKGSLELSWDPDYMFDVAYYCSCQLGIAPFSIQSFFRQHEAKRQIDWSRNQQLGAYDLHDGAKILDVGCGVGVNGLLMHKYNPTWNITLLDGNDWKGQIGKTAEYLDGYNEEYVVYNNWDITKNCMKKIDADESKFKFLSPESKWGNYDMIMSTWSYGFHYPLDTYWDRVLSSLNPGGILLLDLYNEEDADRVSKVLDCEPEIDVHQTMKRYLWKTDQLNYG